jgi:small-conductance mechanosensitive channel
MEQKLKNKNDLLFRPGTGTALAVAAGLSFFFLCMILPLVGPAGSRVDHAAQNMMAFLFVLLITFGLAAFAAYSKLGRRKVDGSPLPWFSFGLCGVCVLTLLVLVSGGFAI